MSKLDGIVDTKNKPISFFKFTCLIIAPLILFGCYLIANKYTKKQQQEVFLKNDSITVYKYYYGNWGEFIYISKVINDKSYCVTEQTGGKAPQTILKQIIIE